MSLKYWPTGSYKESYTPEPCHNQGKMSSPTYILQSIGKGTVKKQTNKWIFGILVKYLSGNVYVLRWDNEKEATLQGAISNCYSKEGKS